MRFEEAQALLTKVEQENLDTAKDGAEATACECEAIHALVKALRDDSEGALPIAEACVRKSSDPWTVNVSSNVVRFGHWKAGKLENFYNHALAPSFGRRGSARRIRIGLSKVSTGSRRVSTTQDSFRRALLSRCHATG